MMFYNEEQAIDVCLKEPVKVFELIDLGYIDVVEEILNKDSRIINSVDEHGNSVMMYLLIKKCYDLVYKHTKNKYWNINLQNDDGNTFTHILVTLNFLKISKILDKVMKNKKLILNIKNNKNQTILDRALLCNELLTSTKILKDKRFNNIDILSFKYMYDKYINNSIYGINSKIDNLDIIISCLKKKILKPRMKKLIYIINDNIVEIKNQILNNNIYGMYNIIQEVI